MQRETVDGFLTHGALEWGWGGGCASGSIRRKEGLERGTSSGALLGWNSDAEGEAGSVRHNPESRTEPIVSLSPAPTPVPCTQ